VGVCNTISFDGGEHRLTAKPKAKIEGHCLKSIRCEGPLQGLRALCRHLHVLGPLTTVACGEGFHKAVSSMYLQATRAIAQEHGPARERHTASIFIGHPRLAPFTRRILSRIACRQMLQSLAYIPMCRMKDTPYRARLAETNSSTGPGPAKACIGFAPAGWILIICQSARAWM
jgi:hypothetical protein